MLNDEISELDKKLIAGIDLVKIGYRELSSYLAPGAVPADELNFNFTVSPQNPVNNNRFFRLYLKSVCDGGEGCAITVDVYGEYEIKDEDLRPMSVENAIRYTNLVAALQLMPYIRESVSSLSAKVFGKTITMPVIRYGELEFSEDSC